MAWKGGEWWGEKRRGEGERDGWNTLLCSIDGPMYFTVFQISKYTLYTSFDILTTFVPNG